MLIVNLFISEYLDKIRPWKKIEFAFSLKPETECLCFFFKIKIEKNPGYANKEYNVIFKHIHQDNKVNRRRKRIFIDQ